MKFTIGARVRIPELEKDGTVISTHTYSSGNQYSVRYFDNAEAREVLFFESELEEK